MRRAGLVAVLACIAMPVAAQTEAADSAWASGDYKTARTAYEAVLAGDSTSVRSLYRLAILSSWDGKLDSALTFLHRARQVEPDDPDVRIAEARILSWKTDLRGAMARYDSVLATNPTNREAVLGRAQVLGWSGRLHAADSAYAELMARDPHDLDALAGRAQIAAWNGNLTQAVEYYTAALSVDSTHVRSLVGLAQVRNWQGRHAESEKLSQRALALDQSDREARQVQAAVRTARRPLVELTLGWSHDSDENTNFWETVGVAMYVMDGLRTFASFSLGQLSDPQRDANRVGGEIGANYNIGNFGATAAIGARNLSPDFAADRSAASWRGSMSYRVSSHAGIGAGYAHYPFDETAFLSGQDLDVDEIGADGDVDVGKDLTLGAGLGYGWLSDGNNRHSLAMTLTKRLQPHWTAGFFGRLLGYDQDGVGYFSPDQFLLGEARGSYTYAWPGWEARAGAGLGLQDIGEGANVQGAWHVDGRVARKWGVANEAALSLGWTNSAASSTTGAFRYFTGTLMGRIGL
jgi:tetratricopeptide (TPR) repeat protein